jgi:hypothetical protein
MANVTITLAKPINFGSETISKLDIREPVAGDMRGLPLQMGFDEMLTLAGKLTAQPDSVINQLSMPDVTKVMEVVGDFLQGSPATGGKQ